MATKKKGNKAAGKATASKVAKKGKPSSGNKTKTSQGTTKAKTTKGKKATKPKKAKTKSTKSKPGKKTKSALSSKKKTATKKAAASSSKVKKKTSAVSKGKVARKVAVLKGKTKKKVVPSKTPVAKKAFKPKRAQPAKTKTSSKGLNQLSSSERYNVGGLCACVIETFTKEGQDRLQRVVTHLGLSDLEQANLVRVSQGLRIPKLFADGLASEETRLGVLKGLSQFAKADDPSGKRWKTDLEDFARLLGG